jgi:hypothetical protein
MNMHHMRWLSDGAAEYNRIEFTALIARRIALFATMIRITTPKIFTASR